MSSILGAGGYGTVPHTATPSAPAVIMDESIDGGCNTFSLVNLHATAWLWVRISKMHPDGVAAFCILPGERLPLVDGFNSNGIIKITAWTTLPNVNWDGTQAASDINVVGGRQRFIG
jgi:hypothetical protein